MEDPAGWIGPRHADAAIAGDTGILVNTRDVTSTRNPRSRIAGVAGVAESLLTAHADPYFRLPRATPRTASVAVESGCG